MKIKNNLNINSTTQYIYKNRYEIIQYVLAVLFCLPFIISARYTVFWSDDYSHYTKMRDIYGGWGFIPALNYAKAMYLNWQGTYFSMFIQGFFAPLGLGGSKVLRLISILNISLFFITFYFLIRKIFTYFELNKKYVITSFILIMFPLFSYYEYKEILYWYSGQTSYSIPLITAFCSYILLLTSLECEKKTVANICFFVSLLFAFLTAGGSLEVAGFFCYSCLLFIIFSLINKKSIDKKMYIFFIISVIGSVINAIAPGNFVRRQGVDSEGIDLFRTIYYSFSITLDKYDSFIFSKETSFILFIFIGIILGYLTKKKIDKASIFIKSILLFFMPVVTIFPVVMGYNYTSERYYFPSRVAFVLNLSFIITVIIFSFYIGNILSAKLDEKESKILFIALTAVSLIVIINSEKKLSDYQPIVTADSLANNNLKESADSIMSAYYSIEKSEDKDAVAYIKSNIIPWFEVYPLSDNKDDWTNAAIARYYQKDSVIFYRE